MDADGNRLINSPKWTLAGGGAYDVPIHIPGGLRLAADAEYQSSTYSNALNRPQDLAPGQTFVNGTATWTTPDPRWSLQLAVRNIFDSAKPVSATYTPSSAVLLLQLPRPADLRGDRAVRPMTPTHRQTGA